MRQRITVPTLIVVVLTLGVIVYFLAAFWEAMTVAYTTTITYTYTVSESVDARGILLREESLLPPVSGILDITRSEGEQVGVGQVVGRIYPNVDAMLEQNLLEVLLREVEVLEYALAEKMDIITVTKIDDDIVNALSTLRGSVASGNYQKLEEQITNLQGTVLRRDYIFGSALVSKELDDRYETVVAEVDHMSRLNASSVNYVRSTVSGAYSILVDGLEYLDIADVMEYSVEDLQTLLEYPPSGSSQGAGKIITGNTWYFVTSLDSVWCQELYEGAWVTLRFSGDFSQDISMKVERIGFEEEGEHLLVLSSDRYLEQTTLLRFQTAELVYQSYTGLRIPKESLRLETYENRETGEIYQVYGVYAVSAGYADFIPVSILTEGSDFFVVRSAREDAFALKAGQEIVVHAVGIYDGKLLFY